MRAVADAAGRAPDAAVRAALEGRAAASSSRSPTRARRWRSPRTATLAQDAVRRRRVQTGFTTFEGERLGQVAQPLELGGDVVQVALYSRSFDDVAETVSFVRERLLWRERWPRWWWRCSAASWSRRRCPSACGRLERAARDGAARARHRAAAGHVRRRARSARARVQRDAGASSARSTWRAGSSSPTPRTSCARRSSRSAGSSSCCRTRSSTRRRATSSSRRWREQVSASRSWPSTCSTCRDSTPARCKLQTEDGRPRRARRGRSPASSGRRSRSTSTELDLTCSGDPAWRRHLRP